MQTIKEIEVELNNKAKSFINDLIITLNYLKANRSISRASEYKIIERSFFYYDSIEIISNENNSVLAFTLGGKKLFITQQIDAFKKMFVFITYESIEDLNTFNVKKEKYEPIKKLTMVSYPSLDKYEIGGNPCNDLQQIYLDSLIDYFMPHE